MMTKLTYLPPESEPILITPTSPLCLSETLQVSALSDWDLYDFTASPIVWD